MFDLIKSHIHKVGFNHFSNLRYFDSQKEVSLTILSISGFEKALIIRDFINIGKTIEFISNLFNHTKHALAEMLVNIVRV